MLNAHSSIIHKHMDSLNLSFGVTRQWTIFSAASATLNPVVQFFIVEYERVLSIIHTTQPNILECPRGVLLENPCLDPRQTVFRP